MSALVELLKRYSKNGIKESRLCQLVDRAADQAQRHEGSTVLDRPPRQVQTRLDVAQRAKLVALYVDGASANELARRFRVHKTTVRVILDEAGVRRTRRRRLAAADIHEAARLLAAGHSMRSLGRRFGVSPETVRRQVSTRNAH